MVFARPGVHHQALRATRRPPVARRSQLRRHDGHGSWQWPIWKPHGRTIRVANHGTRVELERRYIAPRSSYPWLRCDIRYRQNLTEITSSGHAWTDKPLIGSDLIVSRAKSSSWKLKISEIIHITQWRFLLRILGPFYGLITSTFILKIHTHFN